MNHLHEGRHDPLALDPLGPIPPPRHRARGSDAPARRVLMNRLHEGAHDPLALDPLSPILPPRHRPLPNAVSGVAPRPVLAGARATKGCT